MQTFNTPPAHRLNLCETTCEVRDARWRIHIDAGDEPCGVRVYHRQHGDFYDWPEAVFDAKVRAALRAYAMSDNEVTFRTRGAALKAAHSFLKSYGSGEVEYLEWDINSQSMVVVGHRPRHVHGLWWGDDKPDPLAPFFPAPEAQRLGDQPGSEATNAATVEGRGPGKQSDRADIAVSEDDTPTPSPAGGRD